VPEEQETQFGGQSLQTPSTNVDPTLQFKQIEKLLLKQETQISCLHLMHYPFGVALGAKGGLQDIQKLILLVLHLSHGSVQVIHSFPINVFGGLQL